MEIHRFYSYLLVPLILSFLAIAGAYYWKNRIVENNTKELIMSGAKATECINLDKEEPITLGALVEETPYVENNHITQNDKEEPIMLNTSDRQTTPSGLSFIITQAAPADAKKPEAGDIVNVHYTGWLDENGTPGRMFDSSVERGEPLTFPVGVGYVIKGWDEALLDMKVGEKRRIFIPTNLGYGARGAGAAIPPYADLIFDVDFISIESE